MQVHRVSCGVFSMVGCALDQDYTYVGFGDVYSLGSTSSCDSGGSAPGSPAAVLPDNDQKQRPQPATQKNKTLPAARLDRYGLYRHYRLIITIRIIII